MPRACARTAACLAPPWEPPRRDAAFRRAPYCRDHPVRHRFRGAAGIAKAVHPDVALARHRDDPAARCSDDIVAERRQPGACLAAHQDALGPGLKEARLDADNVAKSKVRQRVVQRQVQPPQDVHPRARFPVLQLDVAARRVLAQT